jgi:hypothetical protein
MKRRKNERNKKNDENNETAIKMIRRALTLLQVFTLAQFGCGTDSFIYIFNFIFKKIYLSYKNSFQVFYNCFERLFDFHFLNVFYLNLY